MYIQPKLIKRSKSINRSRFGFLRLDKNERISKFPKNFIKILKKKINSNIFNIYPETFTFYKLLSKVHKLNKNYFIATAGIDLAIRNCIEIFGSKKILILEPTFAMVNVYCKIFRKNIIKVNYDKNLNLDLKKLYKHINKNISLIIISNPNSPTGTILPLIEIRKILNKAKKYNINVVIDEAYYGFTPITSMPIINKYNNLIILRTFSKAYGLAGLRIGYLVANPKIIKFFFNNKPMYEVNSFAITVANILLKNGKIKDKYIKEVEEGKKILLQFFKKKKYFIIIQIPILLFLS